MRFTYFMRRVLIMIPMFFLMTFTFYGLMSIAPGNPVEQELALIRGTDGAGNARGNAAAQAQNIEKIRKELEVKYGLDKPFLYRYGKWLKGIMVMDFGDSTVTRRPAIVTLMERVPVSLSFGVPAFVLSYLICIPLGIAKARKDGSSFDMISSFILFLGTAIPQIVTGILLLLIFCTDRVFPTALFPLGGIPAMDGSLFENVGSWFYFFTIPVLVSMLPQFTSMTILMKNSFLEIAKSDFVRTARAKGLHERVVLFKHALRNALLPLCVGVGSWLGIFLAGSIIIEQIFSIPGMGRLSFESVLSRDYNVLMAVCVFSSLILMAGQLISDFVMILVDPRIELK